MIKIIIKVSILVLAFNSSAFAEDPFSRSFSSPANGSGTASEMSLTSSPNPDDNIHPLVRFDPTKYFVKGVITSAKGAIAIVSLPGYKDFFVFLGDPLGNDLHTIRDISQDYIILGNSTGDEISIPVSNLAQTATMGGIKWVV